MKTVNDLVDTLLNEGELSTTFRHMGNRFLMGLAHPTRHAFENNRKALTRTINGATSIEDISFLRRDLNSGGGVLEKRLANTVDPEEKAELRKHIAWLKTEYRDLLNKKAKELKGN